jgi:hypothetical protein
MLSTIGHQPSAISHQPSAISHQPSAISHQPYQPFWKRVSVSGWTYHDHCSPDDRAAAFQRMDSAAVSGRLSLREAGKQLMRMTGDLHIGHGLAD